MGHIMQFEDGGRILYWTSSSILLRRYTFEYTTFHGIKYDRKYEVSFVNIDDKNKFKVSSWIEDDKLFDSFDEAEVYIFEKISELKTKIKEEEKEVKAYIEKNNRKKKGSKKSA